MAQEVISRIKVMSDLDISETRVPQDGRFKISVRNHPVDLRVSVMPSMYGEDAVLRILDKRTLAEGARDLRLEVLGLDPDSIRRIRKLASEPYGMVLVTGPTGSGKTTTLYAALTEINQGKDKIVTIEDPVEYQLPGVLQIPVNERKGLTFARGLRSILRHDPDKILVGEIRDPDTAQIAVQSALTGHLVFTSVHANSAFDVIGRFKHMGVDPYSFVSALNGIVAQRLVRINCPDCRRPAQPDQRLLADSGIEGEAAGYRFMAGQGCGTCRGTGFKGRKAIAEFLVLDDELREMIVANAPIRQIKERARQGGTRMLREAALDLVRAGETTLQEINRVTFV
jgi:general secretion pathway protein E